MPWLNVRESFEVDLEHDTVFDIQGRIESELGIPDSQTFWNDLVGNKSSQGMVVYEQDWLYTEFDGLNATEER